MPKLQKERLKDERRLQKERINLARQGEKIFRIQKKIEELEHKKMKLSQSFKKL